MDDIDLDAYTFDVDFNDDVEVIPIDSGEDNLDVPSDLSKYTGDDAEVIITDDVEEFPSDVSKDIGVDLPISEVITNDVAEEAGTFEKDLVGVVAHSEQEAYEMYNDYAFKMGFSVRRSRGRCRVDGSVSMKLYVCSQAGLKENNTNPDPSYSKLDVRSGCEARLQFHVDRGGVWVVSKNVKEHNHDLCPSSSHLLRSHRRLNRNHVSYLEELKKSGVGVATAVRVLKHQSGGSPMLGFTPRDAYNALKNPKTLDGTDSNRLIEIFKKRKATEDDFYFDFQIDSESRLCSFFWRDKRMKDDYILFGDLVVHDTTYRTNKYDMICGPFVGMNHHGQNVMFGCGFLMNETTESFEWLFNTFLRSMNNRHPDTIMTDQSPAMAAAISEVFPLSRHRLCIWHIGENSKNCIGALRRMKGFMDDFNYLLKCCDTIAEFEDKWVEVMSKYGCARNKWLLRLYGLREKWCPAFNKNHFSGGALSSQRSESTNQALSNKLSKTSNLCDFYHCFGGVVADWRSNEKAQDVDCLIGKRTLSLDEAPMLLHARDVYTLKAYNIFEDEFRKGSSCFQKLVSADSVMDTYHVWRAGREKLKHTVTYKFTHNCVSCTCNLFTEVGILCSHSLRVMNIHCVSVIPEFYKLKRWRKDVVKSREIQNVVPSLTSPDEDSMAASLWRTQASRKAVDFIATCENNKDARLIWDTGFEGIKKDVLLAVRSRDDDRCLDETSSRSDVVQNPKSTNLKYKRRTREKPTVEKIWNKVRGRKKKSKTDELKNRMALQNLEDDNGGYVVHPVSGGQRLEVISPNTSSRFPAVLYDSVA